MPLRDILMSCDSASQAIHKILKYRKKQCSRYSHRFFLRKLQVKSTGYLADIAAGRRRLSKQHWHPLMEATELDKECREVLTLLLRKQKESDPDQLRNIEARLQSLRSIPVSANNCLVSAEL